VEWEVGCVSVGGTGGEPDNEDGEEMFGMREEDVLRIGIA